MTLRTKLVFALMIAAILPMLVAVSVSVLKAESRAQAQAARRLETARRQASILVERFRKDTNARVVQAASDLANDPAAFDSLLGASRPAARDIARRLAEVHGLDRLEILDAGGIVLSTSQMDTRRASSTESGVGARSTFANLPEGEAVVREVPRSSGRTRPEDLEGGVHDSPASPGEADSTGAPSEPQAMAPARSLDALLEPPLPLHGVEEHHGAVGDGLSEQTPKEQGSRKTPPQLAVVARGRATRGEETLIVGGAHLIDEGLLTEIAEVSEAPALLIGKDGNVVMKANPLAVVHDGSPANQSDRSSGRSSSGEAGASHSDSGVGARLSPDDHQDSIGESPAPAADREGNARRDPQESRERMTGKDGGASRRFMPDLISGDVPLGDSGWRVRVAASRGDVRETRAELLAIFGGIAPFALASALAIGGLLAEGFSRPIRALARRADEISAENREPFALPPERNEVRRLTASFDRMLDALSESATKRVAAERVAAWQDVARRIAHEVKNPLSPIKMAVENLRRTRIKAPEYFDRALEVETATILEEVESLRGLVDEFSQFARLPRPHPVPCDPREIVSQALALFASRFESDRIRVETTFAPDAPRSVNVDPEQLGRVLKNVLSNAVEALSPIEDRRLFVTLRGSSPGHSTRSFTARSDRLAPPFAKTSGNVGATAPEVVSDDGVEIEVRDNGVGFEPGVESRIFEPYFTTHADSGGTGLGMAIAQRIITEHGGTIQARGMHGRGATFTIRLPSSQGQRE